MWTQAMKKHESYTREAYLKRFMMLIKGNLPANPNELQNWLRDMEDYKFRRGQKFEYRADKIALIQIESVLDEMVYVKYLNS
jgi:hypothetical protein